MRTAKNKDKERLQQLEETPITSNPEESHNMGFSPASIESLAPYLSFIDQVSSNNADLLIELTDTLTIKKYQEGLKSRQLSDRNSQTLKQIMRTCQTYLSDIQENLSLSASQDSIAMACLPPFTTNN